MTYKNPPNLSALRQARLDAEPLPRVRVSPAILATNRKRSAAKVKQVHLVRQMMKRMGIA